MLHIQAEDPGSPDAQLLMDELSTVLAHITGDSGRASFNPDDVRAAKATFVIARNNTGQAVGCGAFRPLGEGVAEIKRMYSRPGHQGVGSAILAHLEARARTLGYQALWLETRKVNERAVNFYRTRGFQTIDNYGKYLGNTQAICFAKQLG
ncbi:GNAT family N-acetyltransferase [Chitinimonas sp. JJ19]|uniref:GNAT family N-acetyltransferase n=1 Tax=Chitinimonas sp. JJ19 TaxID=3109352 RepID=UPI003001628B